MSSNLDLRAHSLDTLERSADTIEDDFQAFIKNNPYKAINLLINQKSEAAAKILEQVSDDQFRTFIEENPPETIRKILRSQNPTMADRSRPAAKAVWRSKSRQNAGREAEFT